VGKKKNLTDPKFHVNYAQKKNKNGKESEESASESEEESGQGVEFNDDQDLVLDTKEKKKYNSAVRNARARVESLFGELSTKFKALDNPWRESKHQLDYMVAFACGLNNKLISEKS
jgi:hypothetical protein